MLLMSDILDKPIRAVDNGEPLVSLRANRKLLIDEERSQITSRTPYFCWVREDVARRIEKARSFLPRGYTFLVKEGFRPAEVQRASYDATLAKYAAAEPGLGRAELAARVSQYVAPVEVAGHPTGGAVDLTLARDGVELFMGTAFNDEPGDTGNRTYTASPDISAEAARLRSVLGEAMERAGFVNYPSEWWHWSYGDKYWARVVGADALYGPKDEKDLCCE